MSGSGPFPYLAQPGDPAGTPAAGAVPYHNFTMDGQSRFAEFGLLAELSGTWQGQGFSLIARPDFRGGSNLYLQLNQTRETLQITPMDSPVSDRGLGEADVEQHGLTYLDKIVDALTDEVLHIEPGIWTTQGSIGDQTQSGESLSQIVARMASIPHGNALLAQGTVSRFEDEFPALPAGSAQYAGSVFPSFNSTPFLAAPAPRSPRINADGSSLTLTAAALVPPAAPFSQYDLSIPASAANPRTPFGGKHSGRPLPAFIDGVPMQDVINDPIRLLQAVIKRQRSDGHTFSGAVINISTQRQLTFLTRRNDPAGPRTLVSVAGGAGGIENILFLEGGEPTGATGPNAQAAQMYATFWIERVSSPGRVPFMQLQYAQMTVLDFEILKFLPASHVNLGWPHVSVATLTRASP